MRFIYKSFLNLSFLLFPGCLFAQFNAPVLYNSHFSSQKARFQPAYLGEDMNVFELSMVGNHFFLGNSAVSYGQITEFWNSETVGKDQINELVDGLKENNLFGVGFESNPISLSLKIKQDEKEFFTLGAGINIRAGGSFNLSKNFLSLIWKGNKQFRDKKVNLGPFGLNGILNKSIYLAYAMPLPVSLADDLKIKPGVRLRYIMSSGGIYTSGGDLEMYTHPEGRYLKFIPDYKVSWAIPGESAQLLQNMGKGYGIDIGTRVSYDEKIVASVSVADIGSVKYTRNTKTYQKNKSYVFDGIGVDIVNTVKSDQFQMEGDTIAALLKPEVGKEPFTMPLGTKMILDGEYRFGRSITMDKKEKEFFRNHIFFTYIQGFSNLPFNSKRPFFSAGFSRSFGTTLNLGGMASYGGYNKFSMGGFLSVKLAFFRLGLGSGNLLPLLIKDMGTGAAVSFNSSLSF